MITLVKSKKTEKSEDIIFKSTETDILKNSLKTSYQETEIIYHDNLRILQNYCKLSIFKFLSDDQKDKNIGLKNSL